MAAYPRKQTVVIFILCAFAVGGAAYYVYGRESEPVAIENEPLIAYAEPTTDTFSGSTDWKGQFLDDSVADGSFKATAEARRDTQPENLTATDLLGRSFLTKYAELRQRGLASDEAAISSAVNESLAEIAVGISEPRIYSAKDISVTSDSATAMSSYGRTIDRSFDEYTAKADEAVVALAAFQAQDASLLVDIDPIITTYTSLIAKLLVAPAPKSLAARHLELVNGLSLALYSARSFRVIDTNPVQAMVGIELNISAEQGISASFAAIRASIASTSKASNS